MVSTNTNKSFVAHVGGTRTYMAPELQQTSRFTKGIIIDALWRKKRNQLIIFFIRM